MNKFTKSTIPQPSSQLHLQTTKFSLSLQLNDQRLSITLCDYLNWNIFSKTFTNKHIGREIQKPMGFDTIFQAFLQVKDLSNLCSLKEGSTNLDDYVFGSVISKDHVPYCKIQSEGVLTVYLSTINRRTQKEMIYESSLILDALRSMTPSEISIAKLQTEKNKLERQVKRMDEQHKKNMDANFAKIKQLEQKNSLLDEENKKLLVLNEKVNNLRIESLECKIETNSQKICQQINDIKKILSNSHQAHQSPFHQKHNNSKLVNVLTTKSEFQTEIVKQVNYPHNLVVYTDVGNHAVIGGRQFRCCIGKNGLTNWKQEGDGKTPIGIFPLREIWVRNDRVSAEYMQIIKNTSLPVFIINEWDGWCDESSSKSYNKHVDLRTFDKSISHENLWRSDNLYDVLIVVGYNDKQPIPKKGSAIFVHIARPEYSGTAGCVAFSEADLRSVIEGITFGSQINIQQNKY